MHPAALHQQVGRSCIENPEYAREGALYTDGGEVGCNERLDLRVGRHPDSAGCAGRRTREGGLCMGNNYVCQKSKTVVPSSGVVEHHQTRFGWGIHDPCQDSGQSRHVEFLPGTRDRDADGRVPVWF